MKLSRFFQSVSIILVFGTMLAGCNNSPVSAQARVEKIVSEMKPQLPKMLDSDTKLINVYNNGLELVSSYELTNYPADEPGREEKQHKLELYLKNKVCSDIKPELLSKGISSHYIYNSKEGEVVLDLVLKPGDC